MTFAVNGFGFASWASRIPDIRTDLAAQLEHVKKRKEELDKFNQQKIQILENLSKLTADEAREQLVATLRDEAQTHTSGWPCVRSRCFMRASNTCRSPPESSSRPVRTWRKAIWGGPI